MNREPKEENDLFFTCNLVEFIARKTKNTKKYVVQKLGKENIQKIYNFADVYHCENIDKISDEFINKASIEDGTYDILNIADVRIPSYFELGRIYSTLILKTTEDNKIIDNLIEVLSSWIIEKIDNYESSMYYESPDYIFACYKEGQIL